MPTKWGPVIAQTQEEWSEEAQATPPDPGAGLPALLEHSRRIGQLRAVMTYSEQSDRCKWCLAIGREVTALGKRGLGTFCTEACRDGWAEFVKEMGAVTNPLAGALEK